METELKELELHELMATKDVIVLTSIEATAVSWLIECYQENFRKLSPSKPTGSQS